jgi:hypothetical protein
MICGFLNKERSHEKQEILSYKNVAQPAVEADRNSVSAWHMANGGCTFLSLIPLYITRCVGLILFSA